MDLRWKVSWKEVVWEERLCVLERAVFLSVFLKHTHIRVIVRIINLKHFSYKSEI